MNQTMPIHWILKVWLKDFNNQNLYRTDRCIDHDYFLVAVKNFVMTEILVQSFLYLRDLNIRNKSRSYVAAAHFQQVIQRGG
mgnify:CR=1 FL=1